MTLGLSARRVVGPVGLVLAVALALVARSMRPPRHPPVLGHIPPFQLVDQRNLPFTNESMLGHPTVVDFIFTRCTSSCPRLTSRMAELQAHLDAKHEGVQLLSFSVDPENDTPPVLAEYGARAKADPSRWTFVTGSLDDIERAVVLGFKVSAAKVSTGAQDYEITHGDWFVAVDARGDIRGYYPTASDDEFRAMVRDVDRL